MITLVTVAALGFLCLLLEILNLRKILVPVTLIGLLGALGLTAAEYISGELIMNNEVHNMIVSSGYSQGFSMLLIILTICVIAMCPSFYKDKIEFIADYVAIKIFILAGAIAMVSFGNLTMFFLGLEVLSIGAYVLASSKPNDVRSNEAGMKYFIMGAFASGFIVFGIALLYGAVGSLDITIINATLYQKVLTPIWFHIGVAMIIIGLFFKISIAPFHFWAPDVYDGSPNIVTALMATVVKVAAIAAVCKFINFLQPMITPSFDTMIVIVSLLTMTIGNITALRQTNMKRMMAYSGMSHAGFMIMSLLKHGGPDNTILYYGAAYSFAAMAAFAVIMAISKGEKTEEVSNFNGLGKRHPLMAVVMSGALLSLAGVPVFAGFFAKLFTFGDMLEAGHLLLVIVGILNSVVALFYYLRVINAMFLKENTQEKAVSLDINYKIVAVLAISLNFIIGVFPAIITSMKL